MNIKPQEQLKGKQLYTLINQMEEDGSVNGVTEVLTPVNNEEEYTNLIRTLTKLTDKYGEMEELIEEDNEIYFIFTNF